MLPEYVHITDGKGADNTSAGRVKLKAGDIVVCDWGYFDTELLNVWDRSKVFFVARVRDNMLYERIEERDLPDKAHPEVLIDEIVKLTGTGTSGQYQKAYTPHRGLQQWAPLRDGTCHQQLSPCGRNHCGPVQGEMGHRDILPQPETELPHQEFCGNITQCGGDTGMDSTHHDAAPCLSETESCLQMALLQPRFIIKAEHLYENEPVDMAQQSFHATAGRGNLHIGGVSPVKMESKNINSIRIDKS